ncbi:MAG: hypothetical protein IT562_21055 [Alphaproteobacteria bacterium]|nr:hypothetical protein [Alphaproteobacteria bacterium]
MDRSNTIRLRQHAVGSAMILLASGVTLGFILAAPRFLPMHDDARAIATESCHAADRAAVDGLKPLLERTDQRATVVASSVLATLATARRYCAYGEGGRAVELYAQAGQVLEQFRAERASYSR